MLGKALVYLYFALPILLTVIFMVWQLVRIRRKTRWPISDKLLRPPGESCRRKLEQFDERWLFQFLGVFLAWDVCVLILIKIQQAVAPKSLFLLLTMLDPSWRFQAMERNGHGSYRSGRLHRRPWTT